MDKLKSGDILYHGSYCLIQDIDISKCLQGKDFGRGFYVTTSYRQAKEFVRLSVRNAINSGILKNKLDYGYVNSYLYTVKEDVEEYDFLEADTTWLHFVSGNRDASIFEDTIKAYERFQIIGGKIANDRTAVTLSQYINGIFGTVGEETADRIAIELLLPNRLEDQCCFRGENAIQCLSFQGAEKVQL